MFNRKKSPKQLVNEFLKNNPQHKHKSLRYTIIPKGQHLISVSAESALVYKFGERADVVLTDSPVVYGPALLIVDQDGKHLAIFPQ